MERIEVQLNDKGFGKFYIEHAGKEFAKMEVSVSDDYLTVFHTEVSLVPEGKGLAKELLHFMADYARKKHIKVIALCPFVKGQFEKHTQQYDDIWEHTL